MILEVLICRIGVQARAKYLCVGIYNMPSMNWRRRNGVGQSDCDAKHNRQRAAERSTSGEGPTKTNHITYTHRALAASINKPDVGQRFQPIVEYCGKMTDLHHPHGHG